MMVGAVPGSLPLGVHISAYILSNPCWILGTFGAFALLAVGLRRLHEDEVARLALVTAALFVASSIHIPIGVFSVHLILNGLAGILLGRRAFVAVPLAVFLQAWLLGHGDLMTWGVNSCVIGLPTLMARPLFLISRSGSLRGLGASLVALSCLLHPWSWLVTGPAVFLVRRVPGKRPRNWIGGFVTCSFCVLCSCLLQAGVLAFGGSTDFSAVAALSLMLHAPLALLEGFIGATIVQFLFVMRPPWAGMEGGASATRSTSGSIVPAQSS